MQSYLSAALTSQRLGATWKPYLANYLSAACTPTATVDSLAIHCRTAPAPPYAQATSRQPRRTNDSSRRRWLLRRVKKYPGIDLGLPTPRLPPTLPGNPKPEVQHQRAHVPNDSARQQQESIRKGPCLHAICERDACHVLFGVSLFWQCKDVSNRNY